MKLKSLIIVFVFLAFLMARDITAMRNAVPQPRAVVEQVISNPAVNNFFGSARTNSDRTDTTTIWFDDLEGDVSGWQVDTEWNLTETSSNSPTHSFNVDDDNLDINSDLTSPSITLPTLDNDNQLIKFSFAVWCDLPDHDGDGDNTLEDYYRVWVANVSDIPLFFHTSTYQAYSGNSWWCGDPAISGYNNSWLQALESPEFTVSGTNPVLTSKIRYYLEEYTGAPQTIDGCTIDGWDAANVRISTDGGSNWNALAGTPAYTYTSCYGWSANDDGCNIPGWGHTSGTTNNGWVDANFDLSAYAGQSVKIRYYFGSDVGFATPDDPNIDGFFIDDIMVSNDSGDTLLFDNADDAVVMTPISDAYLWEVVFYDYGDTDRPGGLGWQEYLPGYPFDNPPVGDINVQLDLSAHAGDDILLRWSAITDDNHDGGNGSGLYIDDVHVWLVNLQEGPPPLTGLNAVAGDAQVIVTWDDLNQGGFNGDIAYDDGSFEDRITLSSPGEAYLGTLFDATFGVTAVTVNSVDIFGYAGATGTANIYGFAITAGEPEDTPLYTSSITLVDNQWTTETLTGWSFTGDFLIALGVTDVVGIPLDVNTTPSSQSWSNLGAGWSTWADVAAANSLPDGEWGIRANVTSVGSATATYNVYRNMSGGDYGLMFNGQGLIEPEYTDIYVTNNVTFCYKVAAIYNDIEGEQAGPVCATPEAQTIHELAYDDGDANTSNNMGNGNYIAVKFTPEAYPSDVVRLKYYCEGSTGGVAVTQVWDDDGVGGMPGTPLLGVNGVGLIISLTQGWNEKFVADQNITITGGSFYVGYQETPNTPPFGIDNDSPPDYSFVNYTGNWEPFSNIWSGAIMIRVDVDSAATAGVGDELLPDVPQAFSLAQNYPNPFNPVTKIEFDLPEAGNVELTLYDVTGQMVKNMLGRQLNAGHYQYHLNASDLASGIYFYHLQVTNNSRQIYSATRKLMLIK